MEGCLSEGTRNERHGFLIQVFLCMAMRQALCVSWHTCDEQDLQLQSSALIGPCHVASFADIYLAADMLRGPCAGGWLCCCTTPGSFPLFCVTAETRTVPSEFLL